MFFGRDDIAWLLATLYLGLFFTWIWSLVWAFGDAGKRGKPGCLVGLMVGGFWPMGVVIWLVFRPDLKPKTMRSLPQSKPSPEDRDKR